MRGRPARSVVVPWSRALAAGVAALCAGAPLLAQFHEDVVVERVRWPVRLTVDHDVPPGACLSPASVRVTEDGASSEVVGVESDDEPVLHVVLLDASGSMEGNQGFATAVRLLREYIDAAPAGDRFALFTFDQDLVLRVKPLTMVSSRRSSALVSGLEDLPLTNGTSLRDDVRFLCDYLSDLPGTKSVLVLTDGLDNESGATPEFVRNVIGAATAMDVTWWTVVVGAGSGAISKKPEAVAGRSFLRAIAEQSGGAFFDAETSGPSQVARHILEQLRHRAYVVYRSSRPPPGPRAPTEARRVRVLSQRSGCRFSADREERCAGECGMTLAPRERGDDPSMAGARGHRLRLPPEFAPFADRVSIEAGAGLVSGSTLDVVRDPMELYPDAAFDPKHVDPPTIFPAPEYAWIAEWGGSYERSRTNWRERNRPCMDAQARHDRVMGRHIDVCGCNPHTRLRVGYSIDLGRHVIGNRGLARRATWLKLRKALRASRAQGSPCPYLAHAAEGIGSAGGDARENRRRPPRRPLLRYDDCVGATY